MRRRRQRRGGGVGLTPAHPPTHPPTLMPSMGYLGVMVTTQLSAAIST